MIRRGTRRGLSSSELKADEDEYNFQESLSHAEQARRSDDAREWFENQIGRNASSFAFLDDRARPDETDLAFAKNVMHAFFVADGQVRAEDELTNKTPSLLERVNVPDVYGNPRLSSFASRMMAQKVLEEVYDRDSGFARLKGPMYV